MDYLYYAFIIFGFLAVVLFLEGGLSNLEHLRGRLAQFGFGCVPCRETAAPNDHRQKSLAQRIAGHAAFATTVPRVTR